jgi:Fe-S-cluster containining protein
MRSYDRGDGTCKHLTAENLCAIYEGRPLLCRVDEGRPPVLTEAYWNAANHLACKRLHLQVYGQEQR